MYCFEGVWEYSITRLLLFIGIVIFSLFITTKLQKFLKKIKSNVMYNLTIFAVFNVISLIFSVAIVLILMALDPFVSAW